MKKITSLVLVTLLVCSLSISSVFADTNADQVEGKLFIETISEEEFVKDLAREKGISIEEARILNNQNTEKALYSRNKNSYLGIGTRGHTDKVYYKRAYKIYRLNSDVSAEIGAKFKVLNSAGNKEILETCGNPYTRKAAGASIVDWEELSVYTDPAGNYPTQSVTVLGCGYFYFEIDNGASVGFDLAGFSASGSTSTTTTYTSRTMDLQLDVDASDL
ncbi:hypothetical protein [Paramaledivibacter caminithermalis]|jgi:hypothetical protein|uniref:Uncharacterized protein n=1 Tax=Paramaledivibacter caminithermalis (strain DSM 15212 / CIP 107654 / DViRD3) TaxID=1121301 RepID=A0A1M6RE96_PARC5|nr:hypothetical protein [Paramaledivibacter caminithermalis]SHK30794.1 hypothetical protein SAMN02745912_02936 [Paramaledivibacter caminithermalis DSM 15212]